MGDAVDNSLKYLTPGDIAAIVSLSADGAGDRLDRSARNEGKCRRPRRTARASSRTSIRAASRYSKAPARAVTAGQASSPLTRYATLTGARAVNDPTATNVAQIVLNGMVRDTPHGKVFMPAFGNAYSDAEVAAVANYVTARFGAQPSSITAKQVAKLRQEN